VQLLIGRETGPEKTERQSGMVYSSTKETRHGLNP